MMAWKKGKTFKKGNRTVRYIYRDGKKATKKLVTVKKSNKSFRRRY
jgi:hypothetical protein